MQGSWFPYDEKELTNKQIEEEREEQLKAEIARWGTESGEAGREDEPELHTGVHAEMIGHPGIALELACLLLVLSPPTVTPDRETALRASITSWRELLVSIFALPDEGDEAISHLLRVLSVVWQGLP